MNTLLAAGWLALASPVAACPPEPRLDVAVLAEHFPPAVRSSYTFGELNELAAKMGRQGRHAPLGFYVGTFGYTVDVEPVAEPGSAHCDPAIRVQVRLLLGERLVEVGTGGPCRPEAVLSHYLVHADQDDRLLSRYASQATTMFDRMPRSELLGAPAPGDAREDAVETVVRRAMDGLLSSYDEDWKQASAAADSDEELARLREACGRNL